MVAWWWIPIAWVIGELMGFGAVIICMGGGDKEKADRHNAGSDPWTFKNYSNETLKEYAESANKKAADAGTSTADRETVRKDFFL